MLWLLPVALIALTLGYRACRVREAQASLRRPIRPSTKYDDL